MQILLPSDLRGLRVDMAILNGCYLMKVANWLRLQHKLSVEYGVEFETSCPVGDHYVLERWSENSSR